jgi:hypothetical protein
LPNFVIDNNPTPASVAARQQLGQANKMINALKGIATNFFIAKYAM